MSIDPGGRLTTGRAFAALCAGAGAGAGVTAAMVAVGSLGAGLVLGDPALAANGLPLALLVGVFAVPVWAWGLTCVGIPVWAVLHAGGVRDPRVAALVGAGLAFLVSVLLIHDMGGLRPFTTEPPWVQGALALAGAVAGWVTGRVAYDRPA